MSNIVKALDKILERGTKIVSFEYDGEARNVLIGANGAIEGNPVWGKQINRAIRAYKGALYLVGIDNNDGHTFKTFKLDKIENPSFC
jgi:hypothetical protein